MEKASTKEYWYFCYDCQDWYHPREFCKWHPITFIRSGTPNKGSKNRIRETLPSRLQLSKSAVAGHGVFAKEDIPERCVFGPYQGEYLEISTTPEKRIQKAEHGERSFEIMQGHEGDVVGLVDGSVKELCCFLSKVNCARNQKEHNMDAFQYEQSVYFRTIRPIKRGEELLVRYGDVYEQQLGIDFNNPNAKSHFQQTQAGLYFCPLCNICFHSKEAFNNHKTILPCSSDKVYKKPGKAMYGSEKEPYVCSTCGQCYSDLCLLKYHMLNHDAPREFGCDQCLLRFFKEEHYQEHLKWCEPDFPT